MRKSMGFVLAALALACGGDKVAGPNAESVAGSYSLRTVNGSALPFVVAEVAGDRLEVTAGALSVNADNSYVLTFTLRETQGASVTSETTTEEGTYHRSSNTLSFHPNDDSGDWSASFGTGGALTMTVDGVTLSFHK